MLTAMCTRILGNVKIICDECVRRNFSFQYESQALLVANNDMQFYLLAVELLFFEVMAEGDSFKSPYRVSLFLRM